MEWLPYNNLRSFQKSPDNSKTMGMLAMIIQFLLGLSIIVGLHELGHLLFAKLFGMRVESYSIGFPPKIFWFKWGETEYSLGAIPLGGAVKIAGMVDESLDTIALVSAPKPWEFRAKPAWQRLVVILGGVFLNIVSGVIIYTAITFSFGDTYLTKKEVNKHGIVPNAVGSSLGFREGDQIINIGGRDFEKFADVLQPRTLLATDSYYTVLREGQMVRIDIPVDLIERLSACKGQGDLVTPRVPFTVGQIQRQSGAAKAGLQSGDQIIAVSGKSTIYFHQFKEALEAEAGKQVLIDYVRAGVIQVTTAQVSDAGILGFQPEILLAYDNRSYSLGQAIAFGFLHAFDVMRTNVVALGRLLTGQLSPVKSLSGPIGIAKIFGKSFDWIRFWNITSFLSLTLAFTNLLPIPALDGGHTLWIIYEIVTGRRLSDKFLETAQKIGMGTLLFLISYTFINDLYQLL
jgi:regulator of sigma E protease